MSQNERKSAGLEASRVPAPHLRDPRSLSRPQDDGFVPETELKFTDLYRKPRLSTYESEREKECGTGSLSSASATSARSRVSLARRQLIIYISNHKGQVDGFLPAGKADPGVILMPAGIARCMVTGGVACLMVSGAGVRCV